MKRFSLISLALCAGVTAFAGDVPMPNPHLIWSGPLGQKQTFGASANSTSYSNITTFNGFGYAAGGAGLVGATGFTKLIADDLEPAPGYGERDWSQWNFSIGNLGAAVDFSARPRIRFWLPDVNTGLPAAYYVAGYSYNPLNMVINNVYFYYSTIAPGGMRNAPEGMFLWYGTTYDNLAPSTATVADLDFAGVALMDPPTVGSSEDVFFQTNVPGSFFNEANPAGGLFNFAGAPVANFYHEIQNYPIVISGHVNLQDYDASTDPCAPRAVVIEIRETDNTVIETWPVTLDGSGNYSITTDVHGGDLVFSCKGANWLRQNVNRTVTGNTATAVDFDLINGDCDDDNEVNIVDNGILATAFGTSFGDAGYVCGADLDGDGEVNIVDAGILSSNFGEGGDE